MAEGSMEREAGARRPAIDAGTVVLAALYVFTAVAVAGYGVYGLHPERLPQSELALRLYASSFELFARMHIVVAALVLAVVLVRTLRARWLPAFVSVCVLSFTAEHLGTGYGIPFGGYGYTGLLGLKIGGRVPLLIPVSWFLMALPSWVLARSAFPEPGLRPGRVGLGALWLVAWDLALDPAMSFLTPYWQWAETGPYYGMPWLNLVGWYATGLALMTALELFAESAGWDRLGSRWMAGYYLAVVLMPLSMIAAAGLWVAVATTLLAMSACWGLTRALAARRAVEPRRSAAVAGVEA